MSTEFQIRMNLLKIKNKNPLLLSVNVFFKWLISAAFLCLWSFIIYRPAVVPHQIQDIIVETGQADQKETRSAKDALLLWCQMKTAG